MNQKLKMFKFNSFVEFKHELDREFFRKELNGFLFSLIWLSALWVLSNLACQNIFGYGVLNQTLAQILVFGVASLVLAPFLNFNTIKYFLLGSSLILLGLFILVCMNFNPYATYPQFLIQIDWVKELNFALIFGLDGLNILLVGLTFLFGPINLLLIWDTEEKKKMMFILVYLVEILLLLVFVSLDLFTFFVFFEMSLVPMLLIILIWGPGIRRIKAAYYFLLYTLFGSLWFLISIFILQMELGTTNWFSLLENVPRIPILKLKILWFFLFLAFAIKVPMFILHLWLPEAHVEAPTVGSVILASLLLKTGGYGILRFLLPISTEIIHFFLPIILTICLIGIFYCSFLALVEADIKRVVAYSSVVHMNGALLGAFSLTSQGISGFILTMVAHGFVSGALFMLIGYLYKRHHTKGCLYYGGLANVMPVFAFFFSIFVFSNFSVPGSLNFVSELLIYFGSFNSFKFVTAFYVFSAIFSTLYSIALLTKLCFGSIKSNVEKGFNDLNFLEFSMLIPLVLFTYFLGYLPQILVDFIQNSVSLITSHSCLITELSEPKTATEILDIVPEYLKPGAPMEFLVPEFLSNNPEKKNFIIQELVRIDYTAITKDFLRRQYMLGGTVGGKVNIYTASGELIPTKNIELFEQNIARLPAYFKLLHEMIQDARYLVGIDGRWTILTKDFRIVDVTLVLSFLSKLFNFHLTPKAFGFFSLEPETVFRSILSLNYKLLLNSNITEVFASEVVFHPNSDNNFFEFNKVITFYAGNKRVLFDMSLLPSEDYKLLDYLRYYFRHPEALNNLGTK